MSAPNGGPAFPHAVGYPNGEATIQQGMTLRDYFAAAAMAAIISAPSWVDDAGQTVESDEEIAAAAWQMAEKMIAARSAGAP